MRKYFNRLLRKQIMTQYCENGNKTILPLSKQKYYDITYLKRNEMKNNIIINTGTMAGTFRRDNRLTSATIHNETHRKYSVIWVDFFFIEKQVGHPYCKHANSCIPLLHGTDSFLQL